MSDPISALFVEHDERLARSIADYLADHGVHTTHVRAARDALDAAASSCFDIVVLEVVLPDSSGIGVCQSIRKSSDVPIIIVSGLAEEADRVLGLESGADDYVIKPFSPRELLARMHAVVRRDRGYLASRPKTIQVGPLVIEEGTREVSVAGVAIAVTTVEFCLLSALAKRPGRIFSREQLLRLVRGDEDRIFDRAIDVHVSRLRQKLSVHPAGASLILTVRGAGYTMGKPSC